MATRGERGHPEPAPRHPAGEREAAGRVRELARDALHVEPAPDRLERHRAQARAGRAGVGPQREGDVAQRRDRGEQQRDVGSTSGRQEVVLVDLRLHDRRPAGGELEVVQVLIEPTAHRSGHGRLGRPRLPESGDDADRGELGRRLGVHAHPEARVPALVGRGRERDVRLGQRELGVRRSGFDRGGVQGARLGDAGQGVGAERDARRTPGCPGPSRRRYAAWLIGSTFIEASEPGLPYGV